MTKRTLAALAALLAFMAVLVAVPLATSDTAEAHTKTVKRCSYDPFTNVQQCWTETVAHTHRVIPDNPPPDTSPKPKKCPAGTTGTPPDCLPIPPDNTNHVPTTTTAPPTTTTTEPPRCPAGYSGTPPNCIADVCPAGYSGTPPNCVKDVCPDGWTGTPPDCRIIQTVCPDGYSGTPPNCVKDVCPDGETGTPPNCQTVTVDPPPCLAGEHRHGNGGCGPDHEPPCGVGKWNPGHGHALVDRPACTYADAGHATGPITYCGTQSHTHKTRHFHYGGNGCHPTADTHPTGTTSTDPCESWVSGTSAALKTANSDGSYNIPNAPTECKTSARQMLGRLRVSGVNITKTITEHVEKALNQQWEAIEANHERDELLAGYIEDGWNATPKPIQDTIKAGVCIGLVATVVVAVIKSKGKIAKAGPFAEKAYVVADAAGCTALVLILNAITVTEVPDDDSGDSGDGNPGGTDDDSGDDDSSTDGDDGGSSEEDADPEPTPGICDRNSAPTNPYKIGPSNTTPQQWADWYAWFDCS